MASEDKQNGAPRPSGRRDSGSWHFDDPRRKGVLIRWQMTHWCNFDCAYCCSRVTIRLDKEKVSTALRVPLHQPPALDRPLPPALPKEQIKGHAFINYTVDDWCAGLHQRFGGRNLAMILNGGEPFWDLANLCRFLWEVCGWKNVDNIRIGTNASWTPPQGFASERLRKINLNAAWHPSQISMDRFVSNLRRYQQCGLTLTMVNFVMRQDQIDLYEQLAKAVAPLGVPVNPSIYIPTLAEKAGYKHGETEMAIYRRYLTDFDITYRSGVGNPKGKPCRYPTVAYMMDVGGELAVACYGVRRGHLLAGPIPERLEGWADCPKTGCICVDMYSFLQEAPSARTRSMNLLAEYVRGAIRRGDGALADDGRNDA
jgi:hypothetical protein